MSRILGGLSLILALLACSPALRSQQHGTVVPEGETSFRVQWGNAGEPGSFNIWFGDVGGSIWSIWLTDHFQTVAAGRKTEHELTDYYRAVENLEYRKDGPPNQDLPPQFMILEPVTRDGVDRTFGFHLQDTDPEGKLMPRVWERQDLDDGAVGFRLDGGQGMVLHKVYRPRVGPGGQAGPEWASRIFDMEITLESTRDHGDNVSRQFQVDLLGLALMNPQSEQVVGNPAVTIVQKAEGGAGGQVAVLPPAAQQLPTSVLGDDGRGGIIYFAGATNRFFGAFMFPLDEESEDAVYDVLTESMPPFDNGELTAWSVPRARYRLRMRVPPDGRTTTVRLGCYLGPKSYQVFNESPEYERFVDMMNSDFRSLCFCEIPGVRFMAGVLLKLLGFFQSIAVNWGLAIVMLTLMVRGLLVPLNFRMQKSMRAFGVKMAKLKPEMDALKKKYEKDPKAYQQAMMAFNREHKIVPPIGGCLPIFLTMPVWIGLFTALRVAYDLRQEPFMLWVDDLSRPDALIEGGLSWIPIHFEHFNLLPLIMMGLWYWAQSSTPLPTDPQQRQMMKIMRFLPFVFGIMLYNYASGLMLYMITSSCWALVEMRVTRRILGPMPTTGGVAPITPM